MRIKSFAIGAAGCLALAVAAGYFSPSAHATGPIPVDCDRACLEGLVNQYLAALVAHDPKRLPLAADVKYTENEQVMDIGDGFWNTATAVGNYKHYFADPANGQAGFMGTMQETDSYATVSWGASSVQFHAVPQEAAWSAIRPG